ncbi:MAG: hypothetical protein GY870_18255 [archaeon]|nr:hypothetical protein [archaeon]
MTSKSAVTLVGKSYAQEGFKFLFKKSRDDICPKSCRFFNPCMGNLKPLTTYIIVEKLNIEHNCPSDYHEESMELVRVEESPIEILMESKSTFLGASTSYDPLECEFEECPYKEYCIPIKGLSLGSKIKIVEIVKKVKDNMCKRGLSIVIVEKIKN